MVPKHSSELCGDNVHFAGVDQNKPSNDKLDAAQYLIELFKRRIVSKRIWNICHHYYWGSSFAALGADTTVNSVSGGHITSTITTFYWGAHTPTFNVWNRNGSANYYRCVLSTMLHEAGHSMGLDEAMFPITAGDTVMNPGAGTNDAGHFALQQCNSVTTIR